MTRTLIVTALLATACGSAAVEPQTAPRRQTEPSFEQVSRDYVIGFLQRNPVVATYLGAAALDPSLADIDGRLRDHSAAALAAEDRWLQGELARFQAFRPSDLTPAQRIDRNVAMAQIRFLLRQHQHRRHQERAVDTYVDEPFRGVDWQLQGLTRTGPSTYGTEVEWQAVVRRVQAIPAYLAAARAQLEAGIRARNTADHRMLRRNGIDAARASAAYFARDLGGLAAKLAGPTLPPAIAAQLAAAGRDASAAYTAFADFVAGTFFRDLKAPSHAGIKPEFGGDRYAFGAAEYDWALASNLRVARTAAVLYEESWPTVQETRGQMIALAREIGRRRSLDMPADDEAAVRRIFEVMARQHPRSDEEMLEWYRASAVRLVDYGRRVGLFDIPDDYKLDVTLTPPPLQASSSGAAYYPAPPFKGTGVGRFYVSTSSVEERNTVSPPSLADLTAHEGFPGHDWHYKVMTEFRRDIPAVRWLTPGAVEDSSSMWQDSMAIEGWALYAEALLAEPQPGAPSGLYTPEERLYQLQGLLLRDVRIRLDVGIHTGRLTYDQAVDLMSQVMDFQPGSCAEPTTRAKRTSCEVAEQAIFRYSKWPTQAITYRLGRDAILDLRRRASAAAGSRFSAKAFHLALMKQGPIPVGHFAGDLLRDLKSGDADIAQ